MPTAVEPAPRGRPAPALSGDRRRVWALRAACGIAACAVAAAWAGLSVRFTCAPAPVVVVSGTECVREEGPLDPDEPITIRSDLARLSLAGLPSQQAGIHLEVRTASGWLPVTNPRYGDWTYPAAGVHEGPSAVHVTDFSDAGVTVVLRYAGHEVPPALGYGRRYDYPFEKWVHLRAHATGYYAAVIPERRLPAEVAPTEHEIGLGGVWGDALLTTDRGTVEIDDTMTTLRLHDDEPVRHAALQTDARLVRYVVPLPEPAPMIVPAFPNYYGGTYLHHERSQPYGAYIAGAAAEEAPPADAVAAAARHAAPEWIRSLFDRPTAPPTALTGGEDVS